MSQDASDSEMETTTRASVNERPEAESRIGDDLPISQVLGQVQQPSSVADNTVNGKTLGGLPIEGPDNLHPYSAEDQPDITLPENEVAEDNQEPTSNASSKNLDRSQQQ